MIIYYLLALTNILGNALENPQGALINENTSLQLLQTTYATADGQSYCDEASLYEGKKWANDVIRGNFAAGYENQYLDESTNKGANPELDARGADGTCDKVFGPYIFHRGIKPTAPKNAQHCNDWFKWFQTDPCRHHMKACRTGPRGNIKISREKTGGWMWHNGGYGCKDWTWDKIFFSPRIGLKQFLEINVPEQDALTINESQLEGTWDCHNTCELQPPYVAPVEPIPTAADVKPLSIDPNGPTYFKNKGQGNPFLEAREFCQRGGGDLVSIHSKEENEAIRDEIAAQTEIWIGAIDTAPEGSSGPFAWTDGSPWDYEIWNSNEPNNWNGVEDCTHTKSDFVWNDTNCLEQRHFVCKYPAGGFNLAGYSEDAEDGEEE